MNNRINRRRFVTTTAAAGGILAAGLGACMIMSFDPDQVTAAVGSPNGYRPVLVVALGEPAEEVVLEEPSDRIEYWRDDDSVHHVPKLPLDRIIH